ncbi:MULTISPECIES: sigma factor [Sphingobacterium]|uniref:sigma factor n=1 Tax=Sphingobacterium TaxID=28453 RepID=UPI0021D25019|nr:MULTISPECIES: sigma factor [unclassified Sphingobacterium]
MFFTVYAYPFVNSEIAKDIVQEAFIILIDRTDILARPEQVIKSFLHSTVKNQCLNHKRREATAEKVHTVLRAEEEGTVDQVAMISMVSKRQIKQVFEMLY